MGVGERKTTDLREQHDGGYNVTTSQQREQASQWFLQLQQQLCQCLEALEENLEILGPEAQAIIGSRPAGRFTWREWKRQETLEGESDGGGGRSALLYGRLFEKAGINVSEVHGTFSPEFAAQIPGADQDPRFWASGISLVIHPWSPFMPTIHMNTRLIMTTKHWFGGGIDLTPMYPQEEETQHFHSFVKAVCDRHDPHYYEKFKQWCDNYFYLPHRREARGIGGIFYDYINTQNWEKDFAFCQDVGKILLTIYPQIIEKKISLPWGKHERHHQLVRRGRYVEFNLMYDRGTLFGLKTGGNVDSILMSLPPQAAWNMGQPQQ